MAKQIIFSFFFTFVFIANNNAQIDKNSSLYKTILAKDSLLFDVGFNSCDISQFEKILSDDFEFLHDKDGISDKNNFIYNLRKGLCASPETYQSRRELVAEKTEIHPLYKNNTLYGVIQNGCHRFYETISGKKEVCVGLARFTHLWLLKNNNWKLAKSYSFDHQENDSTDTFLPLFDNDIEIEKWLKEINVPTLGIGLINDGKLQQVKVFGELKPNVSAPYNTIFNVASLTKPVTAMVTLKLVSQGKWNLDKPVYGYWTDMDVVRDKNHKLLTTRHILSHQSGFPNWRSDKLRFEFTPGANYQYSGEGFEYLRKALEKKFGKSLNELATDFIFKPLKMSDTNYFWTQKTDETRFAIGYNNQKIAYKTHKNKTENAADDLLTTIENYGVFLAYILNGGGLSEKNFNDLTTPQTPSLKGKFFGLGFEIYKFPDGEYALSHSGGDDGCQTVFFLFPKTKRGILIFTNVDDGYKVYEKILTHYLGEYGKKIIEIETK